MTSTVLINPAKLGLDAELANAAINTSTVRSRPGNCTKPKSMCKPSSEINQSPTRRLYISNRWPMHVAKLRQESQHQQRFDGRSNSQHIYYFVLGPGRFITSVVFCQADSSRRINYCSVIAGPDIVSTVHDTWNYRVKRRVT